MSPQSSPNGVRRVNRVPFYIATAVISLFVLIVLWVAMSRQKNINHVETQQEVVVKHTSSQQMIEDVLPSDRDLLEQKHHDEKKEEHIEKQSKETPIEKNNAPQNESPTVPTLPFMTKTDPVALKIEQQKLRALEKAINEKTRVEYKVNTVKNNIDKNSTESAINSASNGNDKWTLKSKMDMPSTAYLLRAGAVLPGIMISGINSDLPGNIVGQVSENVYDTATGKYLLIPQGTQLYGEYANHVAYGQEGVFVEWNRLVFPDGKALDIGEMHGTDSAGYAGFRDQVNNHYLKIFGSAILMSGITAGVSMSQKHHAGDTEDASSALSESLGQQLGNVSSKMISKNLDIAPTLEIRPGYRFSVIVMKDLKFNDSYHAFDY